MHTHTIITFWILFLTTECALGRHAQHSLRHHSHGGAHGFKTRSNDDEGQQCRPSKDGLDALLRLIDAGKNNVSVNDEKVLRNASTGFDAVGNFLDQVNSSIDIGKTLGNALNSRDRFFSIIEKFGGNCTSGVNGFARLVAKLVRLLNGHGSVVNFVRNLIDYYGNSRTNNTSVRRKWRFSINNLFHSLRRLNLVRTLPKLDKLLEDLRNNSLVVNGVNVSAIIETALRRDSQSGIYRVIGIIVLLQPRVPPQQTIPILYGLLISSASSSEGRDTVSGLNPSFNITGIQPDVIREYIRGFQGGFLRLLELAQANFGTTSNFLSGIPFFGIFASIIANILEQITRGILIFGRIMLSPQGLAILELLFRFATAFMPWDAFLIQAFNQGLQQIGGSLGQLPNIGNLSQSIGSLPGNILLPGNPGLPNLTAIIGNVGNLSQGIGLPPVNVSGIPGPTNITGIGNLSQIIGSLPSSILPPGNPGLPNITNNGGNLSPGISGLPGIQGPVISPGLISNDSEENDNKDENDRILHKSRSHPTLHKSRHHSKGTGKEKHGHHWN